MLKEIQEALARRQETVEFHGRVLVVREVAEAAELGITEKGDPDAFYKIVIGSVFIGNVVKEAEGEKPAVYEAGEPALTLEDLPTLKEGSRRALRPLLAAVSRVNGLDAEAEAKK